MHTLLIHVADVDPVELRIDRDVVRRLLEANGAEHCEGGRVDDGKAIAVLPVVDDVGLTGFRIDRNRSRFETDRHAARLSG